MKKIIISADVLKKALAKLSHAINAKGFLPITQYVWCRVSSAKIDFIATNTEIIVCSQAKDLQLNDIHFDFLIPYEFLKKIVEFNPHSPIEIEAGIKKVKVKVSNDVYEAKLPVKVEDFPKLPDLPSDKVVELSKEILTTLNTALATALPSGPNVHNQLTNVLLELSNEKITIASSDGAYSVFSQEFSSENAENQELLLGSKAIAAINGLTEAKVYFNESWICFEAAEITVYNIRTKDKFVNFRKVFPDNWLPNLSIHTIALSDALAKTSMATDDLKSATLTLSSENVNIQSYDSQFKVNLDVEAVYNGTVTEVAIKYDKLQKMLGQIDAMDIEMAIHDASKAIVITSKEIPGYRGMIMPIAQSK